MNIDVSSEEFRAAVEPLLRGVSEQLAGKLVVAAERFAEAVAAGCMDKAAAAKYLGQSVRTIENWMRTVQDGGRGLPHSKIGETVIFRRVRIDAWLLTLERNTPAIFSEMVDDRRAA